MDHIVITDIFNNKIYNTVDVNIMPFILIHTNKPHLILRKISSVSDVDGIWTLIIPTIHKILQVNKIDPLKFSSLGDIWYPSVSLPHKLVIPLVNINISAFPIDYVKLDNYTDLNIWKPICTSDYHELGLIASQIKPPLDQIRVVNKNYLIEYPGPTNIIVRNTNMNEYNFLSNIESNKYTIDKQKLNKLYHQKQSDKKTYEGKKTILIEPEIPWYALKYNDIMQQEPQVESDRLPSTAKLPVNSATKSIQDQININVILSSLSLLILLLIVISHYLK